MKKNKIVFMVIAIFLVIIIILAINYNKIFVKDKKASIDANINIGIETFENIKKGHIKVSCNDAKLLGTLFVQINKEMKSADNLTEANIEKYATSTTAKQKVNDFSNMFLSFIKANYSKNMQEGEAIYQGVNLDIYTNIVQPSIMIVTGNISEKEFFDYIDIEYCGKTPPASYISPKDIVLYSINNANGRGVLEELIDNKTKK